MGYTDRVLSESDIAARKWLGNLECRKPLLENFYGRFTHLQNVGDGIGLPERYRARKQVVERDEFTRKFGECIREDRAFELSIHLAGESGIGVAEIVHFSARPLFGRQGNDDVRLKGERALDSDRIRVPAVEK